MNLTKVFQWWTPYSFSPVTDLVSVSILNQLLHFFYCIFWVLLCLFSPSALFLINFRVLFTLLGFDLSIILGLAVSLISLVNFEMSQLFGWILVFSSALSSCLVATLSKPSGSVFFCLLAISQSNYWICVLNYARSSKFQQQFQNVFSAVVIPFGSNCDPWLRKYWRHFILRRVPRS